MAIDLPSNITAVRKANAGCYSGVDGQPANEPDRCQNQGMACNVYPYIAAVEFAVDVEQGGPVSRCVDSGEDTSEWFPIFYFHQTFLFRSFVHVLEIGNLTKVAQTGQNAMLNLFYNSAGPWSNDQGLNSTEFPVYYQQIFANAGELQYCSGLPSDCITDGSEFDRNGAILTYDPLSKQQKQRRYRLSGGGNITVMEEMEIGREVLLPRVTDGKKFLEASERRISDWDWASEALQQYLYLDVEVIEKEVLDIAV